MWGGGGGAPRGSAPQRPRRLRTRPRRSGRAQRHRRSLSLCAACEKPAAAPTAIAAHSQQSQRLLCSNSTDQRVAEPSTAAREGLQRGVVAICGTIAIAVAHCSSSWRSSRALRRSWCRRASSGRTAAVRRGACAAASPSSTPSHASAGTPFPGPCLRLVHQLVDTHPDGAGRVRRGARVRGGVQPAARVRPWPALAPLAAARARARGCAALWGAGAPGRGPRKASPAPELTSGRLRSCSLALPPATTSTSLSLTASGSTRRGRRS